MIAVTNIGAQIAAQKKNGNPLRSPLSQILFLATCGASLMTLLPGLSHLRYPYFERFLDVFFWLLIFLVTKRGSPRAGVNTRSGDWLLCCILLWVTACFLSAWYRFGSLYAAVEFRQYLLLFVAITVLKITGRRICAVRILRLAPIYFTFLVLNSLAGGVWGEYYRPGVFGESNYDIPFVVIILCGYLQKNRTSLVQPLFGIFVLVSRSRTALLTFLLASIRRAKSVRSLLFFLIFAMVGAWIVLERSESFSESSDIDVPLWETLDRVQMVMAYYGNALESPSLLVFGQPISGQTFDSPVMEFYKRTQSASAMLDFNTPSNFHGHLIRGFMALGIPAYLAFLWWVYRSAKAVLNASQYTLVLMLVLVSAFTQSVFSHPFTGAIFGVLICRGFVQSVQLRPC